MKLEQLYSNTVKDYNKNLKNRFVQKLGIGDKCLLNSIILEQVIFYEKNNLKKLGYALLDVSIEEEMKNYGIIPKDYLKLIWGKP